MYASKRGISDVIVTVLIILISIAAIFIVWQVLKPTLKESTEGINLEQSKVDITIMDKNIIPNLDNSFSIRLFRNAGEGNLVMIKVRVENETSSDVYNLSTAGFTELAEKLFVVPNTIANITKITVIPVILTTSGESEAGISDFVIFTKGSVSVTTPIETPQEPGCPTAECSIGESQSLCLSSNRDYSYLRIRTCTQNLSGCYVWGNWNYDSCDSGDLCNYTTGICYKPEYLAYWNMDSLTANFGPADYYGLINGTKRGNATQVSSGKYGKAFYFDGKNSFVNFTAPSTILEPANNFSVSLWLNANSKTMTQIILDEACIGAINPGTYSGYGFYIESGNLSVYLGNQSNRVGAKNTTYNLPLNQWVFAVMTYDANNLRLYVDGTLKANTAFTSNVYYYSSCSKKLTLGSRSGGAASFFNGSIDDVKIFNRVLSPSEIFQLYNS